MPLRSATSRSRSSSGVDRNGSRGDLGVTRPPRGRSPAAARSSCSPASAGRGPWRARAARPRRPRWGAPRRAPTAPVAPRWRGPTGSRRRAGRRTAAGPSGTRTRRTRASTDPHAARAGGLLRRRVVEAAQERAGLRQALGAAELARDAEVGQEGVRRVVVAFDEQDVRGLDVAMDDPARVRGVERGRDLVDDLRDVGERQRVPPRRRSARLTPSM